MFFSVISTSIQWAKKSSLTQVRIAQTITLHGERYTELDFASKLRCPRTVVHNAIVKFVVDGTFHDRKRFGHPRRSTPSEDGSMRQIAMRSPNSSCKNSHTILALKCTLMCSSTVSRPFSKYLIEAPKARHESHT